MIAKITDPLEHINLQGGWPTPRLHPVEAIKEATRSLYDQKDINTQLTYGPEHGSSALRENVGSWLNDIYGPAAGSIPSDRILISNGASNGLATILQKFSDPTWTRTVWMVEPTYFLACPIFRDAGLGGRIRGVPEGDDGADLDFLRRNLEEVDSLDVELTLPKKSPLTGYPKLYRHIIYMIPTFSNPSGKTMSFQNRMELIRLARKHDALIVTDDVYDVLRWPAAADWAMDKLGRCPLRLVDVDRELEGTTEFGNSVSNGSFSKIVAPGIRVGWLEGTPSFISAMATVGATVSGGCQSHFGSLVVNQMLANGSLMRHIEEVLIPIYRKRYYAMIKAIKQYLYPLGIRIVAHDQTSLDGFAGGFFLYLTFKDCHGVIASDVARVALSDFNLRIAPGDIFAVPDDPQSKSRGVLGYCNGARLCWAWNEDHILIDGIQRLAKAVNSLVEAPVA